MSCVIFLALISHYRRYRWWCIFFLAGASFSVENAKLWQFWLFFHKFALFDAPFTGLNSVVVPPKLTNIRYGNDHPPRKQLQSTNITLPSM